MENDYLPLVRLQVVKEKGILYGKEQICTPENAAELARKVVGMADREHVLVISVDARMYPAGIEITSIGTLDAALSSPREVFKHAVMSNAYGIIMVHNHPTGETEPSRKDWKNAKQMKKAGELLGIPLLDHVIVGEDGNYRSMAEMKRWNEI